MRVGDWSGSTIGRKVLPAFPERGTNAARLRLAQPTISPSCCEGRPVLGRLLILFTVVPLVELTLLFWVADHTNWAMTLLLVVGTAILGGWLARREGIRCWREFQERLARGEMPTDYIVGGLLVLIAGALLVTPGLITDTIGFLLLFPPSRAVVVRRVVRRLKVHMATPPHGEFGQSREPEDESRYKGDESRAGKGGGDVIDVEFRKNEE